MALLYFLNNFNKKPVGKAANGLINKQTSPSHISSYSFLFSLSLNDSGKVLQTAIIIVNSEQQLGIRNLKRLSLFHKNYFQREHSQFLLNRLHH